MEDYAEKDLYEKRRIALHRLGIIVYLFITFVQIVMYFVMKYSGLIYQSTSEFILVYMLKPFLMTTTVVIISSIINYKAKSATIKNFVQILMILLMLASMAYVHHVFSVLLVTFGIPIFLTVVLQDKKILNWITVLCEVISFAISLDCYLTGYGASKDTYFIPTVVIIMIVLFACRFIAAICIDILNEQQEALIVARNEAMHAKKEAEESSQSKSRFLSNMSHEIRTPINAVLSLDTMILRESNEENIRNYAVDIQHSGQTLLSLINDVLDVSKIESGKMEIVETDYDLAVLIRDVMNMINVKAETKKLLFQLDMDESLPRYLRGDDVRIRQILLNLLNNAVKYTEQGSVSLLVSGERLNQEVQLCFRVKDTGVGIKSEDMNKLFGRFERIEEEKNKNVEGSGLGISIVTSLLTLMGSELKVESVYGEGSEFSFVLMQKVVKDEPVGIIKKHEDISKEVPKYEALFTAPEAKVLVVDDNAVNRFVFRGLLKETKVQIEEAESGEQCIELCKKEKYDIIFLDHMMPGMDGIETIKTMHQLDNFLNEKTPVIALTANAVSGAREEYIAAGFKDYLSKPLNPELLEEMTKRYLLEEKV